MPIARVAQAFWRALPSLRVGRPCGGPGCNGRAVAALAPSLPGSRSRTALPGPEGPSCEFASSASSRGATPAMAPMRFSAPRRGGRIAPSARCPSGADRRPRSAVRVRRGGDPAWQRRFSPPPRRAPPFRALLPVRGRCRFPGPGLPGVPRAASQQRRSGPLQGVLPWTELPRVLVDPPDALLGFSPLGLSPPPPWRPV